MHASRPESPPAPPDSPRSSRFLRRSISFFLRSLRCAKTSLAHRLCPSRCISCKGRLSSTLFPLASFFFSPSLAALRWKLSSRLFFSSVDAKLGFLRPIARHFHCPSACQLLAFVFFSPVSRPRPRRSRSPRNVVFSLFALSHSFPFRLAASTLALPTLRARLRVLLSRPRRSTRTRCF